MPAFEKWIVAAVKCPKTTVFRGDKSASDCDMPDMIELTREALAYTIMGGVLLLAAPWCLVTLRRRQRRKLRQRGIKRYGH